MKNSNTNVMANKGNLIENLLILFICFGLFFPSTYNGIKFLIAFGILGLSVINILRGKGKITRENLTWMFLIIGSNLLSICLGLYYHNEGALATVTIDVIWPVFFMICITQIENVFFGKKLFNAFIITAIIICLYDIGFVLKTFYFPGIPNALYSFKLNYLIGRNGKIIEYSIEHFYSLYFLTLATYGLLFSLRNNKSKANNKIIFIALFLELICIILMGKTTGFIYRPTTSMTG